jgi:hypothetical protein
MVNELFFKKNLPNKRLKSNSPYQDFTKDTRG